MPDLLLVQASDRCGTGGIDTAASGGTVATVTVNAAAESWHQLLETSVPYSRIVLTAMPSSAGHYGLMLAVEDIGGGNARNLFLDPLYWRPVSNGALLPRTFDLPLAIPAGKRLSVAVRSTATGRTCRVTAHLVPQGPGVPAGARRLALPGYNYAGSTITAVNAGAGGNTLANTKSGWTSIGTVPVGMYPKIGVPVIEMGATSGSGVLGLCDFAYGASQTPLIENLPVASNTSNVIAPNDWPAIPLPPVLAPGTELFFRHQVDSVASTTTAPYNLYAGLILLD